MKVESIVLKCSSFVLLNCLICIQKVYRLAEVQLILLTKYSKFQMNYRNQI